MAIASCSMPAAIAAFARAARKSRTSSATFVYRGACCIVAGSPRMCMRTTPTRAFEARRAIRGSERPVTSLMIVAPRSSALSATSGFRVSIEIGMSILRATPRRTGLIRRHSSSAETLADPGRVDSPPTSKIEAPCSAISSPRWIASSGARYRPPSEKESGVTFRTPTTCVRSRTISPERWRQTRGDFDTIRGIAGSIFQRARSAELNIPQYLRADEHEGPVPPCRLPRVRDDGEGAQGRRGRPAVEAKGPRGRGARLLHHRREAGREASGGRSEGRGDEHRGGRRPGWHKTDRALPLRAPEFFARGAGARAGTLSFARERPRCPRIRGPRLSVRLLQVVPSCREGPPVERVVARDRRRPSSDGKGGGLRGGQGGDEARLPLAHPRHEGRSAPAHDQGRNDRGFRLSGSGAPREIREVRDREVTGGQGGAGSRPPHAAARAGRLRAGIGSR